MNNPRIVVGSIGHPYQNGQLMARSIPTVTFSPGNPRAFAQKNLPAPRHLTVNFFPAPGHSTTPGIFKMCTVCVLY